MASAKHSEIAKPSALSAVTEISQSELDRFLNDQSTSTKKPATHRCESKPLRTKGGAIGRAARTTFVDAAVERCEMAGGGLTPYMDNELLSGKSLIEQCAGHGSNWHRQGFPRRHADDVVLPFFNSSDGATRGHIPGGVM